MDHNSSRHRGGVGVAAALCVLLLVLTLGTGSATAEEQAPVPGTFVVVIDPGHGGSNVGAPGVIEGVYEKRITLSIARALAHRLADHNISVQMTRHGDEYVSLRDRARLANAVRADLFVSIHANASPDHAQRGFETYVLGTDGLDIDTWATRRGDGRPRKDVDPDLADVLDDVERGLAQHDSVAFAARVQRQLAKVRGKGFDRGVKAGNMDVLMGPTMPAVLVEVGFIDHPVEGTELMRTETRRQIVSALTAAILEQQAAVPPPVQYR